VTDAGHWGVTCTCHGQHMSVAKFAQVFDRIRLLQRGPGVSRHDAFNWSNNRHEGQRDSISSSSLVVHH
jgi:hypothetical protein